MGKKWLSDYKIDIQGLGFKAHEFNFEANDSFFEQFENSPVEKGSWQCHAKLDKSETMIQVEFELKGDVILLCDRSLREFNESIQLSQTLIFKYGDQWEEMDDNLIIIPRNLDQLDLGSYFFEYIVLNLPMKKLHPDLRSEEEEEMDDIVYSTDEDSTEKSEEQLDPRWNALKNLRK